MGASLSLLAMSSAVLARLRALPHGGEDGPQITVYDAEIPDAVPVMDDESGRVLPYAVLYPVLVHRDAAGADLADGHVDARWGAQLSVVAGYPADLADAIDRIHPWLHRWSPEPTGDLAGLTISGLRPPLGYTPGPIRRDDATTPPRFWMPLEFQSTLTT